MSNKTFEGVDGTRLLHIKKLGKHVTMSIEVPGQVHMGITFDPASIPALALAELEAAGVEARSTGGLITGARSAVAGLKSHIAWEGSRAAEAKEQAKEQAELEAEALDLFNLWLAGFNYEGCSEWTGENAELKGVWLAVARKAREMRAEK